ncbi:hypothetical protein [Chromobacterium sp. ATCC 53434]|uniref:hypothetical protein n=1 Tax=Chromobacterium sp. (strain ATCC 53434 / SC 14030) TaxID=2059672 RepID=UPI0013050B24|nr:hypothetical protein [Chromobacterium sp. ATCC 53434]
MGAQNKTRYSMAALAFSCKKCSPYHACRIRHVHPTRRLLVRGRQGRMACCAADRFLKVDPKSLWYKNFIGARAKTIINDVVFFVPGV